MNKLKILFEQCCENDNFEKQNIKTGFYDDSGANLFITSEQKIDIDQNVIKILSKARIKHKFKYKLDIGYGSRKFEFDSQPPLYLLTCNAVLNLEIDESHITLGPISFGRNNTPFNEEREVKGFFGNTIIKNKRVYGEYAQREVYISENLLDALKKIKEIENISIIGMDYGPHLGSPNLIALSSMHIDGGKDKKTYVRLGLTNEEMQHDSKVKEKINKQLTASVSIKGGVLVFGNIWKWISQDELVELEKKYVDSIIKRHQALLEKRIEETK